ncbi:hypothetical protein B0H16DRAFT_1807627 [Mycena metata]|uniref:Uncharacterized protein n=1 Tax=Mycena metata TaxID=1033252 RepID=A0AAD7H8P8_9AGAR|nr:hypothetical protein B0H16DRAFT_1807627 [Mycena metata]
MVSSKTLLPHIHFNPEELNPAATHRAAAQRSTSCGLPYDHIRLHLGIGSPKSACSAPELAQPRRSAACNDAYGSYRAGDNVFLRPEVFEGAQRLVTHGFFFAMGGFVSRNRQDPITTWEQLEAPLGAQYVADIQSIDTTTIMDRSKGDVLPQGVALI